MTTDSNSASEKQAEPVQYYETRAIATVMNSDNLNTLITFVNQRTVLFLSQP
jgi:hypothetical protein